MKRRIDIIGRTNIWLTLSGLLMVASIASIAIFGLNLGIDFTGGSLIEVALEQEASSEEVRGMLSEIGYDAQVQIGDENHVVMRLPTISPDEYETILGSLQEKYGAVEEWRFDSIGPVIGSELKRKSIMAVATLAVLIMAYVAWAFRKVSEPVASWKYGILTLVASVHDVLIPLGVFSVLGAYAGYQIDTAFIAALLTIIGYSINDTIVVFDRTRENLSDPHRNEAFADTVNRSVVQTIGRSINTSFTTLLVLLAVYLFGGETTQPFVLALIIGIIAGAYSSIFLASPLLVAWEKKTTS